MGYIEELHRMVGHFPLDQLPDNISPPFGLTQQGCSLEIEK